LLFSSSICPVKCSSIIDRRSFDNLSEWIELCNENKHEKAVMLLVGNKVDLPVREVSYEEASNKAKLLGIEYY
jgi:GTPase SAR1 family protein